jgi:hypothetical protein
MMKLPVFLQLLMLLFLARPLAATERITAAEFHAAKQPQVAINSEGTIYVVFGKHESVYITRSDDNGGSFSDPMQVATLPKLALGMRRGPRIATAGQNVIVTAISHETGNLYTWRSTDRGRSWSESKRINSVAKSAVEGLHDLGSDGKDRIAALWLDLRSGKTELWASVSNDRGETWRSNSLVYRSSDLSICECCHPSIAFTASGEIVAMWRNSLNGSRDIYRAGSFNGGESFSAATKIGTGTWKLQACPMDGGDLVVDGERVFYTWRRDRTILATTDLASETVISDTGTHPVAVRTAAGIGIIWQSEGSLFWLAPGHPEKKMFSPNAAFASSAWHPLRKGSIVVWEGGDGIYARFVQGTFGLK